jgi:drug/metabolite transporter (DMT)-like permease
MPDLTYGYLMAAAATLCWGVVVVFIKLAKTPGRIGIGLSLATGALVSAAAAGSHLAEVLQLPWRLLGLIFVAGSLQFTVGVMLYYECVQRGAISVAVPITRAKIIVVLALSLALGLEQFRWLLLAAAGLVLAGGVMVGIAPTNSSQQEHGRERQAVMIALLACLSWGTSETLYGLLPKDVPALALNAALLCCGLVAYMPYALISGSWRRIIAMPRRDAACYVCHGLISFGLAYLAFTRAIQIAGPPRVVIITSTYPLISALIGFGAFRERATALLAVGALLLVAGVIALRLV